MSELIIAQVARRATDRRTQIELEIGRPPKIPPPLSEANAEASERSLGFSVPTLLKDVYRKVGNGVLVPGMAFSVYWAARSTTRDTTRLSSTSFTRHPIQTIQNGNGPMHCCQFATGAARSTAASTVKAKAFQSSSSIQTYKTNHGHSASSRLSATLKVGLVLGRTG